MDRTTKNKKELKYYYFSDNSDRIIDDMIKTNAKQIACQGQQNKLNQEAENDKIKAEEKARVAEIYAKLKKHLPPEQYEMMVKLGATKTDKEKIELWSRAARITDGIFDDVYGK